jgi:RNA polymerase sigma factor (sigma-70 family)
MLTAAYPAIHPSGVGMTNSPGLADLVEAASAGNQMAWDRLVERFIPLVRHVVRSFRLSAHDADDACQSVWLRLVEHLGDIREPLALPGWISTTARNECLALLRTGRRTTAVGEVIDTTADISVDDDPSEALYREQRRDALLQGLAEIADRHRDLLLLLLADPPVPYDEISRRLGIAKGSIGPSRARALQKLRETRAMAALVPL